MQGFEQHLDSGERHHVASTTFDLPLFPRETKDEEKTFELGEGRKVVQKLTVKKETGEVTVELRTEWRGKPLVVTQVGGIIM